MSVHVGSREYYSSDYLYNPDYNDNAIIKQIFNPYGENTSTPYGH